MKTLVTATVHFGHLILGYEDESKLQSYVLVDANLDPIEEYEPTEKDSVRVPANLAAAMKLAKQRYQASEAGKVLAASDN